jgi:hypothetical protein
VVLTVRKLRKYVGPKTAATGSRQQEEWENNSRQIRLKADGGFKLLYYSTLPMIDALRIVRSYVPFFLFRSFG